MECKVERLGYTKHWAVDDIDDGKSYVVEEMYNANCDHSEFAVYLDDNVIQNIGIRMLVIDAVKEFEEQRGVKK